MRGRLTVGHLPLEQRILVRIQAPQPICKICVLVFNKRGFFSHIIFARKHIFYPKILSSNLFENKGVKKPFSKIIERLFIKIKY